MYNQDMSFVLEALRNKPQGLFPLDGTGSYQDHSGYNRAVSVSATPTAHPGLVAGVSKSPVLNGRTLSFDSPVFQQGKETQAFSLEAAFCPLDPAATNLQVLGTQGNTDGLVVSGTVVSFVTKYLTAPEARAEYDLQQMRAVHAVGVHTKDKNSLFINGELVSEVSITEEQQLDQFKATNGKLYSSGNFAINGVAFYAGALDKESINRNYIVSRQVPETREVIGGNDGDVIPVSLSNAAVFLDQWWSTETDWSDNTVMVDTAVLRDRLVPSFDGDTSLAGHWTDTFALDTADTTSIYGVSLNWDGVGAVVEVSLDGTTWEAVQRGTKVSTVPEGFDPTDEILLVRVSFPGGIVNDASYMDNLNVVGLTSPASSPAAGRTVTLDNATQERDYPLLDFHDNWGVEVGPGGSVVVGPDTSGDPSPVRTLELWIKRTGATAPVVSVGGTTYINGLTGSTLATGQWSLMHIVAPSDVSGDITITGPAQVGSIGIYETALTAAQIAQIYSESFSADAKQVRDTSVIEVTESAVTTRIYAHDWTISGSG